MKITTAEIAKRAGVSPATVSRVISGGNVSDEKRNAVLAVLNESPLQRIRPRKKRGSEICYIGMLILDTSGYDSKTLLIKLTSLLQHLPENWRILHLPPGLSAFQLEMAWRRRDISGLLLSGHQAPELEETLRHIPHVWLNSHILDDHEEEILAGNEFAGRLAARHLLDRHVRRPLIPDVSSRNPGFRSRIDGFRFEYFSRFGENTPSPVHVESDPLETADSDSLERALDAALSPEVIASCDGIFAPEARLAALLHHLLRKRGRRTLPPMVTCNQGEGYLTGLYPRPATIDLGPELLARFALEQLMAEISGEAENGKRISVIINPRLVPGD